MIRSLLLLGAVLTGCQAPSRSAAYFEANPDEAARVVEKCRTGQHRGRDCEAAKGGLAAVDANKRLELFKKTFE